MCAVPRSGAKGGRFLPGEERAGEVGGICQPVRTASAASDRHVLGTKAPYLRSSFLVPQEPSPGSSLARGQDNRQETATISLDVPATRGTHVRYGIKTNPQHTSWADILDVWEEADGVEIIDSAWVFDHFYPIHGDSNGPCLDGWTVLAALAHATTRLKVGSMVNGMPYRHPAITANMAASLDLISDGRFQLGLGAGWNQLEADAYGITLGDNLTERFDRFDEGVEVVVRMLSQEETTFDGKYFTLTNARNEPKGPQKPHPPLVIGGIGERRTLKAVARWADHWNAAPLEADEWAHKVTVLERHCSDVGRNVDHITKSMMVRPGDDVSQLAPTFRKLADMGLDEAIVSLKPPYTLDQVSKVAEAASQV